MVDLNVDPGPTKRVNPGSHPTWRNHAHRMHLATISVSSPAAGRGANLGKARMGRFFRIVTKDLYGRMSWRTC